MANISIRLVVPLVIAEFAIGKRARTGTVEHSVFLLVNALHGWDCGLHGFLLRLGSIML